MRDNLLTSGLDTLRHNINRRQSNLRLFEFGFVYAKKAEKYLEKRQLAIFLTGMEHEESWMTQNESQGFFDLKSLIEGMFQRLGIEHSVQLANSGLFSKGGYDLMIDKKSIGRLGSVDQKILKKFDVEQEVWYAQIDMDAVSKLKNTNVLFSEISKFPEVRRDLSLVLDKIVKYEDIKNLALKNGQGLIDQMRVFDVFEGKPLEANQKSYALSFTLLDKEKTLEDSRIDKLMNTLISKYESELGAIIRR